MADPSDLVQANGWQAFLNACKHSLRTHPREWAAGSLLAGALVWVYFPVLSEMVLRWGNDSRYSHGFLVPLFSLFLLYILRDHLTGNRAWGPSWWGAALLLVGLATHAAGSFVYFEWLKDMSLLPTLAGVAVLLGGWPALKWAWPAVVFQVFMVPLPFWLEVGLAQPLQRIGTLVSCYAIQTLGFAAYSEGNIIRMGDVKIGVVEACSGLSMLLTFFALSTATAILVRRPLWERLLLVASAVPIALAANISRIIVTAVLFKVAGVYWGELVFHTLAGYLMILWALGILWAELQLIAWVLPTREVADPLTDTQSSVLAGTQWGQFSPTKSRTRTK
jgi:exosortase